VKLLSGGGRHSGLLGCYFYLRQFCQRQQIRVAQDTFQQLVHRQSEQQGNLETFIIEDKFRTMI
jgi:hypothetical protein